MIKKRESELERQRKWIEAIKERCTEKTLVGPITATVERLNQEDKGEGIEESWIGKDDYGNDRYVKHSTITVGNHYNVDGLHVFIYDSNFKSGSIVISRSASYDSPEGPYLSSGPARRNPYDEYEHSEVMFYSDVYEYVDDYRDGKYVTDRIPYRVGYEEVAIGDYRDAGFDQSMLLHGGSESKERAKLTEKEAEFYRVEDEYSYDLDRLDTGSALERELQEMQDFYDRDEDDYQNRVEALKNLIAIYRMVERVGERSVSIVEKRKKNNKTKDSTKLVEKVKDAIEEGEKLDEEEKEVDAKLTEANKEEVPKE